MNRQQIRRIERRLAKTLALIMKMLGEDRYE